VQGTVYLARDNHCCRNLAAKAGQTEEEKGGNGGGK